jgi:hypothetical protein
VQRVHDRKGVVSVRRLSKLGHLRMMAEATLPRISALLNDDIHFLFAFREPVKIIK